MKKTYISPEFLLVELRCTQMLAESIMFRSMASGEDGGWVKEENNNSSTVSDKSVWDNEW